MDEPVTVSYYVNVKNMTHELVNQLRRELEQLLLTYDRQDHEVTITQVYY